MGTPRQENDFTRRLRWGAGSFEANLFVVWFSWIKVSLDGPALAGVLAALTCGSCGLGAWLHWARRSPLGAPVVVGTLISTYLVAALMVVAVFVDSIGVA